MSEVMDKRSLIGFVLITIVVMVWLYYQSITTRPPEQIKKDTTESFTPIPEEAKNKLEEIADTTLVQGNDSAGVFQDKDSLLKVMKYGEHFSKFADGSRKIITIENDLLKAKISTKGATVLSWELKNYKKWDKEPTQLIWNEGGELYLNFITLDNKTIDTRDLYFQFEGTDKDYIRLSEEQKFTLKFSLNLGENKTIVKTMTFYGNTYHLDTDIEVHNLEDVITRRGYNLVWSDGLRYQEYNSVDESTEAKALVMVNGVDEWFNAEDNSGAEASYQGYVDYAAVKTKYFLAAIVTKDESAQDAVVDLTGNRKAIKKEGIVERYNLSFRNVYQGGIDKKSYQVYIGPLDYDHVKMYNLESTINFGWSFIGWIGEHLILPLLLLLHTFIPNYGVTIIVFAIIMKILLYPFTIAQMRSAQKMKLLGPEMTKIREQYKDDTPKQQKEIMKLYSTYGVNPAGGCLPLLLQMPILYALFTMFRTSIELRQTEFIWWMYDLSMPDTIINFGFSFLGINALSGLALAMGVTMFIQQKLTITDPRQKAMVYMMPIMFALMFSYFPAGLNLYYFMFNLLSIGQQLYINNFSKKKVTLEDLKKAPKKEGWLQKKMREAQEIAESKGKSSGGSSTERNEFNPNHRKPKKKKNK